MAAVGRTGTLAFRVAYDAYGEARHLPAKDINGDGKVDKTDTTLAQNASGKKLGQPSYNPDADWDRDGIVTTRDIAQFGSTAYVAALPQGQLAPAASVAAPLSPANARSDFNIGFCGYRFNGDIGAYTVRFRHYDPTPGMCRWLERDPAGYQDGPSLYSYLGRNPMAGTDPYGLWMERPDESEGLVRNAVPGRPRPTSMLQPIYDACSDFWGWVWGAEPAAVKLRGGLGAIASLLEIAGGVLMIKAGVATTPLGGVGLIGIGAGSVSVLHGLDGLWASLKQLWTGEQQQTYTSQLLTEFIGEENAGIVETVISAVGIVRGIMQIPKWGKGIVDGIRNWRKGRACFLAGTLVLTASPAIAAPIESIEAGATVASVDPATGEATTAIVSATPARLFEGTIYDITVDPGEPGGGDETTISATGEHPFLVARASGSTSVATPG